MHRKRPSAAPSAAMRSAIAILRGEHASYSTLLKTLTGHLDRAVIHAFKPRLEDFSTSLNFIDTYLDHFHHPKEDEFLFLALRRHTTECDEVLRDLQFDHAQSASAMDEVNTALDRARSGGIAALHEFSEVLKRYTEAHLAHMDREETLVIPVACRLLVEEDWREIDRAFRANRDPLFGEKQRKTFAGLFQAAAIELRSR